MQICCWAELSSTSAIRQNPANLDPQFRSLGSTATSTAVEMFKFGFGSRLQSSEFGATPAVAVDNSSSSPAADLYMPKRITPSRWYRRLIASFQVRVRPIPHVLDRSQRLAVYLDFVCNGKVLLSCAGMHGLQFAYLDTWGSLPMLCQSTTSTGSARFPPPEQGFFVLSPGASLEGSAVRCPRRGGFV